ncbi:hypothetical protein FJ364_04860, partial [Candidatus Dependentiae bacterium]|nr:hypothetical protein [Candidatus Dependentiae bacterium]
RDRYGIKPLYYRYTNNQLYFCSEVSPLLDFNFGNKTLCRNVLDQILLLGHPIVSGKTVFREIQSLKPGECLIQDKSASTLLHKHNFKHYQFPNIKENQQRLHQQLRNMIQKSVKECTLSNRHIGLALSGGVDSSILAWELNALGIENVTTISVIYVGSSDGIKTLKKLELPPGGVWEKWQHVVVPFDEQDFKRCLCEAIEASALPITLSSYALYFKLAKFAKEAGITVLLSGEGADEIFSGYTSYAVWSKKTKNQLHEDKLRAFYLNDEKIELWKSLLGQERILNVLADFKNSIKYKNETPIKVLLTHELHYSLEPLLIRTDLALMRYSIEGRVPFLHCGIPELLNQLPVEAFFNEAETKPLLRKLYPEYSRLTKIPKTPFRITEKIYLSKEIQEWFRKTLHDNISFLDALKIDFQPLFEKLISRDISPIDFDALFKLVCLVLWQKSHCVNLERTL